MARGFFRRAQMSLARKARPGALMNFPAVSCEALEIRRVFAGFPVAGDFGPQTTIQTGQQVELFMEIEIQGNEAYTGPYRVEFSLSTDESLADPDDVVLATIERNGTIPLAGVRESQAVTIPAVRPGEYFLLATVISNSGFANTGTDTPILGVSTDFRVSEVGATPFTLRLNEVFNYEWSASIENTGASRAIAEMEAILSRDRRIGNGDDVILSGDELPFLDLLPDQTGTLSEFESIIGSATPSGSYYFGLRVASPTDPTPSNNVFVSSKPIVEVIGTSETDGVFTMTGGAGLDKIITHDVPALRANGTGFGPVPEEGGSKVNTFEISNDGAMPLSILSVEGRGQHPGDFTIAGMFDTPIAPGSNRTFTVTFDPTDFTTRRANFLFTTNDPNREKFRMRIAGQGEADPAAPDIEVTGSVPNSTNVFEIANNDKDPEVNDGTDFGIVLNGTQSDVHVFQIRNTGQSDLVFLVSPDPEISIRAASGEAASSFLFGRNNPITQGHLTGIPETLNPGETFNFRVRFAPQGLGNHKPWVEIYTNDPDEPRFRFKIRGVGSPL